MNFFLNFNKFIMWEMFLDLVRVNEDIDYSLVIAIVVGYFFFLWCIVCVWVFFDSRKRYRSIIFSMLLFLFVLFFGPPALIFYIMVRPEHTLEEDYYMNLSHGREKQLRPVYFDGNEGFDISFNLSVQPKKSSEDKHKMTMQMVWLPQDAEVEGTISKKIEKKEGKLEKRAERLEKKAERLEKKQELRKKNPFFLKKFIVLQRKKLNGAVDRLSKFLSAQGKQSDEDVESVPVKKDKAGFLTNSTMQKSADGKKKIQGQKSGKKFSKSNRKSRKAHKKRSKRKRSGRKR